MSFMSMISSRVSDLANSLKPTLVKPRALRRGDRIGIVAPASNVKRADLEAGCERLRGAGYEPFYFDSILERDLYFAGSVERRVRELEAMFARKDVSAIVCARGGYGSNYLLDALDLNIIKANPKIFIGYSDLTALETYFYHAAGLVTFHGPMVAKDWSYEGGVDVASWQTVLGDVAAEIDLAQDSGAVGLADGASEGTLYGGCLSILVASLGTRYEIDTQGAILFLEDVAEKPFRIDRMLMQLKLAGKLKDVRGIVFGEMRDCLQNADQGYTIEEVILRIVRALGVPVAYGLRSGHVTRGNITLPMGVKVSLKVDGGRVSLRLLEPAVN
jgi:muramoyltetrapeptide carboxypeptidase